CPIRTAACACCRPRPLPRAAGLCVRCSADKRPRTRTPMPTAARRARWTSPATTAMPAARAAQRFEPSCAKPLSSDQPTAMAVLVAEAAAGGEVRLAQAQLVGLGLLEAIVEYVGTDLPARVAGRCIGDAAHVDLRRPTPRRRQLAGAAHLLLRLVAFLLLRRRLGRVGRGRCVRRRLALD